MSPSTTSRPVRVGIDLGGSKISAIALSDDGISLDRVRTETPQDDYQAIVNTIASVISRLSVAETSTSPSIGIGIPGSQSPTTGLIRNANSTCLNGRDLKGDLEQAIGQPVRLANDADCFAISEARDGAGAGRNIVWGIILGTGCGSGIAIDGRLVAGPHAIAGEWGHNPLPWMTDQELANVERCWCGRVGCIETCLSGPAISRDHRRINDVTCTAGDISAAAKSGDLAATRTLARHLSRLARAMAQVINILDPDVIVIGGGLGQMPHLYAALPGAIAPHVFSDHVRVDVRPPKWGADSGVRGAAWLWP